MCDRATINSQANSNLPANSLALADEPLKPLLAANIAALREGQEVLNLLTNEQYNASCLPAFQSTIGGHYRHLLEHYVCFFKSTSARNGVICYDTRDRDAKVEQDIEYAGAVLEQMLSHLCAFDRRQFTGLQWKMRDQDALEIIHTTLARELLFLQAHTVHHHAIIAAMCRMQGVSVPEQFGMAISTQAFLAAQSDCEHEDGGAHS